MLWSLCIIGAYLVGSIPFGLMLGRLKGVDIRAQGSGNVGATNLGRAIGRRWGVLCFFLDAAKGAGPVLAAGALTGVLGEPAIALAPRVIWLWLAVAAAALLGHIFSPWIGFRGGKGVATGFGGLTAMWPLLTLPTIAALLVWIIVTALTRYISLASVCAAASLPVWCAVLGGVVAGDEAVAANLHASRPVIIATTLLALLVAWKHRSNLLRIRRGEEPKIGMQ